MKGPLDHSQANALLPWLVNGTLGDDERALVESHVRSCVRCRIDLKAEQQLQAALRAQPAIHVAPQREIERLLQTIDAPPKSRRRTWTPALAAGIVAAVLGSAIWLASDGFREVPSEYSTLTTGAADTSAELDVVFAPSITAAQMQALLDEVGGTIVAGPSDVGRYRVRLDSGPDGDRRGALEQLAADPRVRFAGPAMLEEPR
jgi:hypothetical protein